MLDVPLLMYTLGIVANTAGGILLAMSVIAYRRFDYTRAAALGVFAAIALTA